MTVEVSYAEKDIEDFLCEDKNLEKIFDFRFIDRQFKIYDFFIDILAYSRIEHCFYIIELKKDELDSKAYTQLIKYLILMQHKYKTTHSFKGLLIGKELNDDLHYIVEFYNKYNLSGNRLIKYNLFNFTLKEGISFNWQNKEERKIKRSLEWKDFEEYQDEKSR